MILKGLHVPIIIIIYKNKDIDYRIEMCQFKDGKKVKIYCDDYTREEDTIIKWIQETRRDKI